MGKGNRNRKVRQLDPKVPFEEYPPWLKQIIQAAVNDLANQARDAYLLEADALALWTLHECFGFGKGRLRRFYNGYLALYQSAKDKYGSVDDSDYAYVEALKSIGVDIVGWNKETYGND